MRADRLRAILEDVPDLAEVTIRITVGGDLHTDNVELEDVRVTTGPNGTTAVLVPADVYGLEDLLDNALAARHAIDDAEDLGTGYLRYTRDDAGEVILDHVDARRLIILDQSTTT